MKLATLPALVPILLASLPQTSHAQYPPDICRQGYVWREAFPGDRVCVTPETRTQAARDNRLAANRRLGAGPYGPNTCRQGFVWREAYPGDAVCVPPETRAQTAADNRAAVSRLASADGELGRPQTCTIYQHRDYGGGRWTLHSGDVLWMVDEPELGTTDNVHRYLYAPSWNDHVSSFKVGLGCMLTLWEHVGFGGHTLEATRSVRYVGDAWNDRASQARCQCPGLPNL